MNTHENETVLCNKGLKLVLFPCLYIPLRFLYFDLPFKRNKIDLLTAINLLFKSTFKLPCVRINSIESAYKIIYIYECICCLMEYLTNEKYDRINLINPDGGCD